MPKRDLWEKIVTSRTLAELSAEEERFFYRLLVVCDDHGLCDGDPGILRARCFARMLTVVAEEDVRSWRDRLADVGLLEVYAVDGETYLRVKTWKTYQRHRDSKPKFPPPSGTENGSELPQVAAKSGSRVVKTGTRGPVPGDRIPNTDSRGPGAGARAAAVPPSALPSSPPLEGASGASVSEKTPPPESLDPSEEDYALGESLGMGRGEIQRAAAAMLTRYRARGESRADWHSTLRGWLRNVSKFDPPAPRSPPTNGRSRPAAATLINAPVSYLEVDEDAP